MKVKIEFIEHDEEDEIIIKCKEVDADIQKIQQFISSQISPKKKWTFYKGSEEFYFQVEDILFFETSDDEVYAHTTQDAYRIKSRLYELEKELPQMFMRVSKSTILNIKHIYSIQRDITASSKVQFRDCYKDVYVSRMYYKALKYKLQERSY